MKTLTLILILGLAGQAAAGYKEVEAATKRPEGSEGKDMDALLQLPGAALAKDARAAAFLAKDQPAMELFRQAVEEPNDGYLLAPKVEKLSAKTPVPQFWPQVKMTRLMIMEARLKMALKQPGQAEKDLLAVAGLMAQFSGQKSAATITSLVDQLCLMKADRAFHESLRNRSVSPAYLKELAARLEKVAKNQDSMKASMTEEAEKLKGAIREGITPETMGAELAKKPLLTRLAVKKLADQEFFDGIYAQFDAAIDEYTALIVKSFRANDPGPVAPFLEKRSKELAARKEARDKHNFLSDLADGLTGGRKTKKKMGEAMVDTMLEAATPSYEKLIPRYHLFSCELGVLRAAAAVKLYQRAKRRLPDSLDQLVPAFLPAVPQDPFNKFAPLAYVKTGKKFLIYGFGPNGKDDGGASALDYEAYFENAAKDAGDIVFRD